MIFPGQKATETRICHAAHPGMDSAGAAIGTAIN